MNGFVKKKLLADRKETITIFIHLTVQVRPFTLLTSWLQSCLLLQTYHTGMLCELQQDNVCESLGRAVLAMPKLADLLSEPHMVI